MTKKKRSRWVPVTRKQMARDFLRDATKALKFAEANPELADYGLQVAAMRAHAAGWLLAPEIAEEKRRAEEQKRLQRETLCAIDVSCIREQCPWRDGMRELSGFGGGYEAACRTMMYAGLLWLNANPNADARHADRDAFERAILRAEPGCSGAMFGAAASHALFIKENGYEAWASKMSEASD